MEERHKRDTIHEVSSFLSKLGYKGYYFLDQKLFSIESFDIEKYQNSSNTDGKGLYINNFVFVTDKHISKLKNNFHIHC